ncbi:MAG: trigger factor [Glaciecola sp.]|jgi:trigger factor
MNITQENIDELNAVLKIEVTQSDYNATVQNKLKAQQKKASMPGFRPGKVPFGMIKKMYGTSIKVEEINSLVGANITRYISDQKLNILGQPLPMESQVLDWANQADFSLQYELGLSPEFDLKLSVKDEFTYYNVVPDAKIVDNYVDEITMRYGKVSNPVEVGEKDMVAIDIVEVEGSEVKEAGYAGMVTVGVDKITNKKIKKDLLGKKQGDKLSFDVKTIGNDLDESALILNVDKITIENSGDQFEVEIGTISRMEAAEINQDLFDKVYGKDTVKTKEEFLVKVKEEAKGMLGDQGKGKLKSDMIDYFLEKLKFELPDTFMKKWLVVSSEGKLNNQTVDGDYDNYRKSIKWQIIENKLIQENDLKVENAEVVEKAKEMITANFKQYGQEVPADQLDMYAQNILSKEEEKRRLYDDLFYDKIIELVKEKCKVEEEEIGYEEFVTLAKQHDHDHDHNHDHDHQH